MKGWVKGMLAGSAVCIGLGCAMCIGAWAMGGRFSYFRNRNYGIAVQEETTKAVDSDEIRKENRQAENRKDEVTGKVSEEAQRENKDVREVTAEGKVIRELEIQVEGGYVEVISDDSIDQVMVTSSNEDYRCYQEIDEDKLEISVILSTGLWENLWKDGNYTGNGWDEPAAEIRIPAGAEFQEVDLDVKGGILAVDRVSAYELNMELGAGKMEVSNGIVQELNSECSAGEMIYRGAVGLELDVECMAGMTEFYVDGSQEDFYYELETAAGSIVIDGKEQGAFHHETMAGDPRAAKKAKLECKTGAINLEFQ